MRTQLWLCGRGRHACQLGALTVMLYVVSRCVVYYITEGSTSPSQSNIPVQTYRQEFELHSKYRGIGSSTTNFGIPLTHAHIRVHKQNKGAVNDSCDSLNPPATYLHSDKSFHRVSKESTETYVFSAFFDHRRPATPVVRIIGLSVTGMPVRYCQVWYPSDDKVHVVTAKYQSVSETHGRKYAPSMHVCKLEKAQPPYAVSLVNNRCDHPNHLLKVHAADPHAHRPHNFTVCVTPFNFQFDNAYQLVEMVEVNRMFGADRIVFYNHTSGPHVATVLEYYRSRGIVDVIQWRIPVPVDVWPPQPEVTPAIHYFGQLVALHDCLYRNMFTSQYIVFTDLDEFIVPRTTRNWREMMTQSLCQQRTSSYIFLNAFFRTDWPDDPTSANSDVIKKLQVSTLLKLSREPKIWPAYQRSKIMVRPEMFVRLGIHDVLEHLDPRQGMSCVVPAEKALLHHYRSWDGDTKMPRMEDKRMLNFTQDIITRTSAVHESFAHG